MRAEPGSNLNNRGNYQKKVFNELSHGVFHKRMINHRVNENAEQSSPGWYICLTVRADTDWAATIILLPSINENS